MPDIPERAALEGIVNGLIHRDYLEYGSEVHIDIFDDRMEIYFPVGMFDGFFVQNLDTNYVPSRRRHPIIADIFSRMNYMERRGGEFKKIKDDYRRAINYRPELEPQFYSDATSFWVTLYNLNYNVPIKYVSVNASKVAIQDRNISTEKKQVMFETILNATNFTKATKIKLLDFLINMEQIRLLANRILYKFQMIVDSNRKIYQ